MNRDASDLRRRVVALGRRTRGSRLPTELRASIVRHALERRGQGDGVVAIARSTGVSPESIRRWTMSTVGPSPSRALVPVVVRDHDDGVPGELVVSAPGGYRVEGLTVESAADLLRRLA